TLDIAATLEKAYGRRDRAPEILKRMRESRLLGRKSGGGFYKYEGKQQSPNESLVQWRRAGSARNDVDLANRLMFLMINEAARCVEEEVVEAPEDADYGMILGTGFAPHRGGPLRFAEHFGLKKIVDEMNRLAQSDDRFEPCEILKKHARPAPSFWKRLKPICASMSIRTKSTEPARFRRKISKAWPRSAHSESKSPRNMGDSACRSRIMGERRFCWEAGMATWRRSFRRINQSALRSRCFCLEPKNKSKNICRAWLPARFPRSHW